jgi:heme/copper-type cytochrome/quinol oxidase subunit 1
MDMSLLLSILEDLFLEKIKVVSMSKPLLFAVIINVFLGILLLILMLFIPPNAAIDIQQHDTYYVISYSTLLIPSVFFIFIKSGITLWARNKIDYQKTITSFLLIDSIIISALIFFFHQRGVTGVPRRYYRFDGFDRFGYLDNSYYIIITLIILLITQLLFFTILTIDLALKKQKLISDEVLDTN